MAGASTIEWTDASWNPVRGCVKVSPGCKHCYAETFAERFRGVAGHPYEQGFDPRLVPESLGWPLSKRKPLTIFVNSMSDLLGEFVPFEYVDRVFASMALCQHHTFQVLTKRAERLREYAISRARSIKFFEAAARQIGYTLTFEPVGGLVRYPLPNVHLGVSVEDRKYGVPRIEHLRNTPAAVRFLSIEPLLEDLGALNLRGIDQVIVGAESGRGARGMNEGWVRSIRDQAKAQGCKFFYKQRLDDRGRKVSLPMLDGQQWAEMPEARR